MSDQLLALLAPLGLASSAFPPTSRYNGVPTATTTTADGRTVTYVTRREVPQPASFATLQTITVRDGDRLDRLAAQYFGDPLAFWRICDANGAVWPETLTGTAGLSLRVTLPAGIAGATRA
jgi:hypothetical protein